MSSGNGDKTSEEGARTPVMLALRDGIPSGKVLSMAINFRYAPSNRRFIFYFFLNLVLGRGGRNRMVRCPLSVDRSTLLLCPGVCNVARQMACKL